MDDGSIRQSTSVQKKIKELIPHEFSSIVYLNVPVTDNLKIVFLWLQS